MESGEKFVSAKGPRPRSSLMAHPAGGSSVQQVGPHAASRRSSVAGYHLKVEAYSGREQWGSRSEFIFCLLGYAIGIGNLWRFPFLVGKYGGGAFLIPYLLFLTLVASPLYLMELGIGQKHGAGAVESFRQMAPRWEGMGYASLACVVIVVTYYNVLLAYSLIYLVNSFKEPLPWVAPLPCADPPAPCGNATMTPQTWWDEQVLHKVDDIFAEGANTLVWQLVAALAVVWALVFVSIAKGIKGTGKVAYVTVLVPVVLLFLGFLRAVSLPNASKGIAFYLTPDIDLVLSWKVWPVACGQILFSLSPAMGTAVALSSFNKRTENIGFDNFLISTCNCAFSLIGGFVVFGVVGYMAEIEKKEISDIAQSGTGLAFVVFAQAVATMGPGWGQLFGVTFYLMLLTLGLDSSFAWVETINTEIRDSLRSFGYELRKELICLGTCTMLFLVGLVFCTRAGSYWLDIIDHYCATYCLIAIGLLEAIMVGWVYGADRLRREIAEMTEKPCARYWAVCWRWIIPPILAILIVTLLVAEKDPYKDPSGKEYPSLALALGWLSFVVPMILVPAFAVREIKQSMEGEYEVQLESVGPPDHSDREGDLQPYLLSRHAAALNSGKPLLKSAIQTSGLQAAVKVKVALG